MTSYVMFLIHRVILDNVNSLMRLGVFSSTLIYCQKFSFTESIGLQSDLKINQ